MPRNAKLFALSRISRRRSQLAWRAERVFSGQLSRRDLLIINQQIVFDLRLKLPPRQVLVHRKDRDSSVAGVAPPGAASLYEPVATAQPALVGSMASSAAGKGGCFDSAFGPTPQMPSSAQ